MEQSEPEEMRNPRKGSVKMTKPKCVHYYFIDSENVGKCTKCGKVRKFPDIHFSAAHIVRKRKGANSGV
ncbi:hypothetical protein ES708_33651 [subsurface metagenome]